MTELLTAAQMRGIEQAAIAGGATSGLMLMERAGAAVVEAIAAEWPGLALPLPLGANTPGSGAAPRAVVLCGPGNNGGDGFVIARLLHQRGWRVRVLAAAPADRLPRDAALNARRWWALGPVEPLTEQALRRGPPNDLYIDAIFGTGLSRAPEGEIAAVLTQIGGRNGDNGYYTPRLVAVDAPSCLCLDSGRSLLAPEGCLPRARLTVTFQALKAGHVLGIGPTLCGKVVTADIGLAEWQSLDWSRRPSGRLPGPLRPVRLGLVAPVPPEDVVARLHPGAFDPQSLGKARWALAGDSHKFTFGHALLLAGGPGRGGAARLAARAALRVGAGLVTLAPPPEALAENAAQLTAVMLRPLADAGALAGALEDRRIAALCLGPGFGTGLRERAMLAQALAVRRADAPPPAGPGPLAQALAALPEALRAALRPPNPPRLPLVLDADALTLLAARPALFAALHDRCILTPHGGEFARLFPDLAARLAEPATRGPAFSKVDATRAAAERAGCVVLFKGPDTVIAAPSGRCAVHAAAYDRAAPWLSTAGAGDVLAGLITGVLARGMAPFDAACIATWLHVEAARSFGPGLIAEDLPEELPRLFRALGL